MNSRKIIHIDMDCFFAAVEMRDNPQFCNIPLAVGGSPLKRGVISTCNYIARKYGVRSAMASALAIKLCPQLKIVSGNGNKYKEASQIIQNIFLQFTDQVAPVSLDEAFLDVTGSQKCLGSATLMAKKIKKIITKETGLIASAGVAPNKLLAKVASDWEKPNGLFVIPPNKVSSFVEHLAIGKIWGVGKVTEAKLHSLGIKTCGDFQTRDIDWAINKFGKMGEQLYYFCRGIDNRPVVTKYSRKSLSLERTFTTDLASLKECLIKTPDMFLELAGRLSKWRRKKNPDVKITKFFVKMKFCDFDKVTVEKTMNEDFFQQLWEKGKVTNDYLTLLNSLFQTAYERRCMPVRLLGMGVRFSEFNNEYIQLPLPFFEESHCI